jgi:cyclophilin family peptidyl-prolyl cis-trans isomerase
MPVCFRSTLFAFLLAAVAAHAAPPEIADPLAQENGSPRVGAIIPFGKTLVLPINATDPDNDPLEFTATSTNPKVFVRVRTGNPILHIHVDYAGDSQSNPPAAAFSGDLEFQLFRDLTPVSAETIAGLAQAGYYENLIFHRIIPNFVAQAGDPAGNGSGLSNPDDPNSYIGLPFQFDHEFNPALIFSGRGQLAMANSNGGYNRGTGLNNGLIRLGDFHATNGSQFFITYAQPRHLDFKHTIFGQLIRGFDVLDKMSAVPRDASDKPSVPVTMSNVTVRPGRSETTLLLSGVTLGGAMITVEASDPSGARVSRRFQVTVQEDMVNDPPILRAIPNLISPVGKRPDLPLKAFDLEQDYLLYGIASANGNLSAGSLGTAEIISGFSARTTAGFQDFALGVAGFNDDSIHDEANLLAPFAPFEPYNFQRVEVGYGDRPIEVGERELEGTAGVALDKVVVAEFRDADVAGQPADFTAVVNWGDGTGEKSSTEVSAASVTIERSSTEPDTLVVKASHTYTKPGSYLVRVLIDAPLGATATVRSHANISADRRDRARHRTPTRHGGRFHRKPHGRDVHGQPFPVRNRRTLRPTSTGATVHAHPV